MPDQCQNCTLPCPGPHACALVAYAIAPQDAGDLDAWFPRDAAVPVAPPAPEQGVIAGVKRDAPKRYARAWYRGLKRDDAPEGDI